MLPVPQLYQDWKKWASALVQQLSLRQPQSVVLTEFLVANLPNVSPGGQIIFVPDEAGGPVMAYSDGTDWRRVSDGAVVS